MPKETVFQLWSLPPRHSLVNSPDVAAARIDWRKRFRIPGILSRRAWARSTLARIESSLSAIRFCSFSGAIGHS